MNKLKKLVETYKNLYGTLSKKDLKEISFPLGKMSFDKTFTNKDFVKQFLLKEIKKQILIEIKPPRTKFPRKTKNYQKQKFL